MSKGKSRDQSLYDFLQSLQKEYIVCFIRKKIYPKDKDKLYYERTMSKKKLKIEDIASRNSLETIFTNPSIYNSVYQEVVGEGGLPDFLYRDDRDEDEFSTKDYYNYYSTGSEVRVSMENEAYRIGVITQVSKDKQIIHVKLRGNGQEQPFTEARVTRIL